ncbi:MAG: zinc ribbon domain-containing protein [Eubacterium sp.]|nr:zinc ribbon domain-containing protein [Eubacterium sp.]
MKCPYCGQTNASNARFCSRCERRLDFVREEKRERKIRIFGIVLIVLILVVGVGALFVVSRVFRTGSSSSEKQTSNVLIAQATATPVPTTTPEPVVEAKSEPLPTAVPTEAPLSAKLVEDARVASLSKENYIAIPVAAAEATSTIYQDTIDNGPQVLSDGGDWTSWQEGVDGPGLGERVTIYLDGEYSVRYLMLRLGNWASPEEYLSNNRPKKLTFEIGGETFSVTFPDEQREFCMELSKDVTASQVSFTIDSVYAGSLYDDTCINEVTVYGI